MSTSLESLERLLDTLLDISKLDAGAVEPVLAHCFLQDLLNPLCEEYTSLAAAKGLAFSYEVGPLTVYTDALLLQMTLRNILSNAIKYTNSGTITVEASLENDEVLITFNDTGSGIAEKDLDIVFDEFVQLNNAQDPGYRGLGLGLSIVKRLSQLLGYKIQLHSTLGQGTSFKLLLPAGQSNPMEIEPGEPDPTALNVSGLDVWIVEDDPQVLQALDRLLTAWGCHTTPFCCYADVTNLLDKNPAPPQIVLADYKIGPDYTGIDVLQTLEHYFGAAFKSVVLTGETAMEPLALAQKFGYLIYHKPVSSTKLKKLLSEAKRTTVA